MILLVGFMTLSLFQTSQAAERPTEVAWIWLPAGFSRHLAPRWADSQESFKAVASGLSSAEAAILERLAKKGVSVRIVLVAPTLDTATRAAADRLARAGAVVSVRESKAVAGFAVADDHDVTVPMPTNQGGPTLGSAASFRDPDVAKEYGAVFDRHLGAARAWGEKDAEPPQSGGESSADSKREPNDEPEQRRLKSLGSGSLSILRAANTVAFVDDDDDFPQALGSFPQPGSPDWPVVSKLQLLVYLSSAESLGEGEDDSSVEPLIAAIGGYCGTRLSTVMIVVGADIPENVVRDWFAGALDVPSDVISVLRGTRGTTTQAVVLPLNSKEPTLGLSVVGDEGSRAALWGLPMALLHAR